MDISGALLMIPRSFFSLVFLFLVTKIIGKKQVSQLSLFDYVVGISIGNFTAEMTMDIDDHYIDGIVAMMTFGIAAFLVSWASMKSMKIRRIVTGIPTIIIENGKILIDTMRKVKIDINDLLEQARNEGYFDIGEIAYAIMEANGKISFLTKDKFSQPTKGDMGIKVKNDNLTANVIIDGNLMVNNIKNTDTTKEWIIKQLKSKGFNTYENILLATYKNNMLNIYLKNENMQVKDVLE